MALWTLPCRCRVINDIASVALAAVVAKDIDIQDIVVVAVVAAVVFVVDGLWAVILSLWSCSCCCCWYHDDFF